MQSSTNYPDESSTGQVQQGIDIQQALSILSARSEPAEDHNDGCGFCQGSQIPESAKTMGQTIDMFASGAKEDEMHDDNRLVDERTERLSKIRVELDAMTDRELLQTVLKTQEDRVATYREYERGLRIVLETGNMTSYPDTCLKATASFAVLSETIKAIQDILTSQRRRKDLANLLSQLQGHEKEKLHMTAAHHLERIRQRNQQMQMDSDMRIEQLLDDGVQSLQGKIHACVEQINEVLDEIRCMVLEED